jgi:hypothetical protein
MKSASRSLSKPLIAVLVFVFSINFSFGQIVELYWQPVSGSKDLADPGNWIDTGGNIASTLGSNTNLHMEALVKYPTSNFDAELRQNLTLNRFYGYKGTITLYDTLTVSVNSIMYSPFKFEKGTGGSIYYSGASPYISMYNYTSYNIDDFLIPGSKRISIELRSCTATLTSDIFPKEIYMGVANLSDPKTRLILNGKKLTTTKHALLQTLFTKQEFVGDENAEIEIQDNSQGNKNLNFSQNTGENVLKALKFTRISNTASQSVATADRLKSNLIITELLELSVKSVLYYDSNLTLQYSNSSTARIYINGATSAFANLLGSNSKSKIVAELTIPGGRRVFRLLTNPFNTLMRLTEFTDDFDITGNGGATNGFTTTTTNNPSGFYFDATKSDNNQSGLDAGWQNFTNATSTGDAVSPGSVNLFYIRGAKGQGLDGNSYFPDSVILDLSIKGSSYKVLNGKQTKEYTSSANSTWVAFPNPYLSPVDIGNIPSSQRTNIGNNFYVFDANLGTNGGFITKSFGSSYVLPALSGFFTNTTASSTKGTIVFNETDKSTSAGDDVFTRIPSPNRLNIEIFKGDRMYDATDLVLDSGLTQHYDEYDALKMSNFDLNLFTVSTEGKHLAINQAFFEAGNIIPLGIETAESGDFTFQIPNNSFPENYKLTLIDALKKTSTVLTGGSSYSFQMDIKNTESFQNRFAIQIDATQSNKQFNDAKCVVYPNPAANNESIEIMANQSIHKVELFDINGKLVASVNGQKQQHLQLPTQDLNAGMFIAKIHFQNQISTQKIIIK